MAQASGSISAASNTSGSGRSLNTLATGAVNRCWAAPSARTTPMPFQARHRFCRPVRHRSHSPHVELGFTATWSPTASALGPSSAPGPSATTVPVASCPGTSAATVSSPTAANTTARILITLSWLCPVCSPFRGGTDIVLPGTIFWPRLATIELYPPKLVERSTVSDAAAWKPGQDTQAGAAARLQGQDPDKIHCPVWGVVGNLGDSICYAGVPAKVEAIQAELRRRVTAADLPVRVIAPNYASGISDGQRNGTAQMRYSLIGRETTNDGVCLHLEGSDVRGVIAVVACDKPPVGTLAAILEHNVPAVIMSDGSIRPGPDSRSGEPIYIISCFQAAADPPGERRRIAMEASPGHGSCGGMFTYNTMQSFIATCGMEPLHMVSPASEDPRRIGEFPAQLLDALQVLAGRDLRPRDIVTAAALRNATLVAIAMGGSTNVVLHGPELARAAGIDFWHEVISQEDFNKASRTLPVLINARPFGRYSMVDIDAKGGLPVIVRELLDAGVLDGDCITCTGETLAGQVARLAPPPPDGEVIHPLSAPFKPACGCSAATWRPTVVP